MHATKIVAAVLDAETAELQFFRLGGEVGDAAGLCAGLPGPVRAACEAGPAGYGLARELERRNVSCVVAAPSKIPRAPGERVKTDRRDAELLVRLLLAGKLHPVRVPGVEEEALRDLVRAREAIRTDLMRSRHRLSTLLLRHGIRFDDGTAWTERHRDCLATITLPWPAAQATLLDAIGAIRRPHPPPRRARARDHHAAAGLALGHRGRPLRCLRGVDTLTAVGLCSEIGDFQRFAHPEQLMSYLGLVPQSTPPAKTAAKERSRRPAPVTPAACSSRPPGNTAPDHASARPSPTARPANPPKRSRSPTAPNNACTARGNEPGWVRRRL